MAANASVQARIDEDVKARAAAVLQKQGMTISDAVRILLTRTANEGSVPLTNPPYSSPIYRGDGSDYDEWARLRVEEALVDHRPGIPNEEVKRRWAIRREQLLAKAEAIENARQVA
jgi:DNA-damage-inducible protein J